MCSARRLARYPLIAGGEPGGLDPTFAAVGVAGCDLTLQAGGQELLVAPPHGSSPLGHAGQPARVLACCGPRRSAVVGSATVGKQLASPRDRRLEFPSTTGGDFRCSLRRCYLCVPPSADRDRPLLVVAMTLCLLLGPLFATGVDVTYASAVAAELPGGGFALSGLPDTCRAIGVDPARFASASPDRAACRWPGRAIAETCSAWLFQADRAAGKRSGKRRKFRVQPLDISALQQQLPRKDIKS